MLTTKFSGDAATPRVLEMLASGWMPIEIQSRLCLSNAEFEAIITRIRGRLEEIYPHLRNPDTETSARPLASAYLCPWCRTGTVVATLTVCGADSRYYQWKCRNPQCGLPFGLPWIPGKPRQAETLLTGPAPWPQVDLSLRNGSASWNECRIDGAYLIKGHKEDGKWSFFERKLTTLPTLGLTALKTTPHLAAKGDECLRKGVQVTGETALVRHYLLTVTLRRMEPTEPTKMPPFPKSDAPAKRTDIIAIKRKA